jgi:hypothetical protein
VVGCWCATARACSESGADEAAVPAAIDSIARAKSLHAEGKTAVAIAQLRRLPPQEAQYAEAQSLIAQWEALIKPAEPTPPSLPPDRQQKREALVAGAERACREQEFVRCDRWLTEAAAIAPLAPALGSFRQRHNRAICWLGSSSTATATSISSERSGAGVKRSRRTGTSAN